MNSGVLNTLNAFLRVLNMGDKPKSPSLRFPHVSFVNMLSHLRSRWMTGVLVRGVIVIHNIMRDHRLKSLPAYDLNRIDETL
jgi:hypothetical protein